MKRIVPILLALVAVGGVIWWLTHRSKEAEVAAPTVAKDKPITQAAEAAPDQQPLAMPALVDDDPPGTLRLEGQVVDASNAPVDGAIVVLQSQPPRTAKTEGDGSFAFTGLVGRTYRLLARHASGVAGPISVRLTAHSDQIVLHLRTGATLEVKTVGIDGKPIDGATVELRGIDEQRATTADGTARFAAVVPGPYQIAAWADGMAHVYQELRVTGKQSTRLVLVAGAAVSGTVVDSDGKPVANARVLYTGGSDFRAQPDPRRDAAVTDASGAFKFPAIGAGSVRFTATHPEHAPGTSSLVVLDGKSEKTGVEVKLAPGATVKGRVIDTAKQPIAGARVQINTGGGGGRRRDRGGPPTQRASHQAYTNDQGEFEIKGLPRAELMVSASHELGASKPKEVDASAGDVRDVELVLDLTAVIAGIVVDPDGNPVEGAQVSAQAPRGEGPRGPGRNNQDVTDGSGKFKITGLAEGTYSLHASRSATPAFGRRGRNSEGVDAKTGDANIKIVLPAEGNLKGKVALEKGGVPTTYTVQIGPNQSSFVGDTFELDGIAPGNYTLSVRGPQFDNATKDITVESIKTTDIGTITLVQGRTLSGIVTMSGNPIANATVYAGRQVMVGGATPNFGGGTKQDTTDQGGNFSLSGFGDGDVTIVADMPGVGRSKAMRIPEENQQPLTVELQPYGSLSGAVHQDPSMPAAVAVTCQSTTTPGAVTLTTAGADGAFRFDSLAPDTYKVSATLGSIRRGLSLYSQQVTVQSGQEAHVDLTVQPGTVTLDITATSSKPTGIVVAYLISGTIAATTQQGVSLAMAGAGAGTSKVAIARPASPAELELVAPGAYTACVVALPIDVTGQAQQYMDAHGAKLAAVCQPATVAASPTTQAISIPVVVPDIIK